MKLPTGSIGQLLNYRVRDNQAGLTRAINTVKPSAPDGHYKARKTSAIKGRKFLPSGRQRLNIFKHLKAFKIRAQPANQVQKKLHQARSTDTTTLSGIVRGSNHQTYKRENVLLHGIPHIQQGTPNGCLDACQEMLLQHFNCKNEDSVPGTRHKSTGVLVMADTKRKLLTGLDNETFRRSMADNKLELQAVNAHDADSIQNKLEQGPLLANIRFARGLSQHSVIVVGRVGNKVVINDPWHGGHQLKSIQWLQKNLVKSPDALSLVVKPENQSLKNEALPDNISSKARKLL